MATTKTDELTVAITTLLREVSDLATGIGAAAPDATIEDRAASLIELIRLRKSLKAKLFKRRSVVSEHERQTFTLSTVR